MGAYVPLFVIPVLITNFISAIVRVVRMGITSDNVIHLLTATALLIFIFNARLFALRVQDRVIPVRGTAADGEVVAARFAGTN